MDEEKEIAQFSVIHIPSGQRVDFIEMPLTLVRSGAVTDEFTLNVPHGSWYTIRPIEDVTEASLREVYSVLKSLDVPTRFQYVLQQRVDGLTLAVENLFGHNSYKRIDTMDELAELAAFLSGQKNEHAPRLVKRPRLGSLYAKVVPDAESE